MKKQNFERLNEVLKESVASKEIAGASLCVLQGGKEVYYTEAGYADVERNKPITKDTIFRLYSMSKPVTATAVMILVERGVIDLLDPVAKYIPSFANMTVVTENGSVPANRQITICDCLSMTSGLTYGGENTKAEKDVSAVFTKVGERMYSANPVTTVEFATMLGECALLFQPGEHFCYGTSADVLGAVVEVASNMKFGEFLQKEIFEPLGMKDTGFFVPASKRERMATAYDTKDHELIAFHGNHLGICNHMDVDSVAFESGGAGLFSTITDYARFTQMLLHNGTYEGVTILSPKTVSFMTSGSLLPHQQADLTGWENLQGFSYHYFMRVLKDPSVAVINGSIGEYGWDGWLGPYFANLPMEDTTFLMMVQKVDAGTFSLTRKLRNVLASILD